MQYKNFLYKITEYLDNNYYCKKHKIEHTGKNAYALEFYVASNQIDKAKELVFKIIAKAKQDGNKWVFYPGSFNHYNKSNNIVDCGSTIDSLSNFMAAHQDIFSQSELDKINDILHKVAYTYLSKAVLGKPITNQRLWGLTGLASYYNYKPDPKLLDIIKESIKISLDEMTDDGFFIYNLHTDKTKSFSGYRGLTTYYQSRCTAFIYYAIAKAQLDLDLYNKKLEQSITALLSMYKQVGYKDLNLECKHWYWLSDYEVASHTFDIYALSQSNNPLAKQFLNNSLWQVKNHIINNYLHSHKGQNNNYQCNLFWNAHLAWLTRVDNIDQLWQTTQDKIKINFNFKLNNIINITNNNQQLILNNFWEAKNFTAGVYNNGWPAKYNKKFFRLKLLLPNKNILISIREAIYHSRVALRAGYLSEFFIRSWRLFYGAMLAFLPIYQLKYGQISRFDWQDDILRFDIKPATRYGKLLTNKNFKVEIVFNNQDYNLNIQNR